MRILITGAAGEVGGVLTRHFQGRYDLVLADRSPPADPGGYPFVAADITDLPAIRALCQDVDTIVHLAAEPHPEAQWESLLPANIVGVYNVLEAAHESGCRRVIFASSNSCPGGQDSGQ